ncbi:MAG: hypothetical protein O9267_11330 [Flavobacterium sp.]|uniref:hypothetical protein n=1 Tax=Flavobacterium sp. TaxID=239 RepID=UPI0022CB1938|nr:hypothetical protein [Flavobacterium sp.]MCZ8198187.1 hypothetical protein [Flavobacterium sp.]
MKKIIFTAVLLLTITSLFSQKIAYSHNGEKIEYKKEKIDLNLTKSGKTIKRVRTTEALALSSLISFLPTIVDEGFKLTTKLIENNIKKFTAEYSKTTSFLDAASGEIPNIELNRTLDDTNQALKIIIEPYLVNGTENFVYYVKDIALKNSAAKFKKGDLLDYSIEIHVMVLENGAKKAIELKPIQVLSFAFEKNPTFNQSNYEYRTEMITISENAMITDISVKVIETNSRKIKAEKIQSLYNDHKDTFKTIINNYLPKSE